MPTGATFDSDGVRLAYDDIVPEGDDGAAPPIVRPRLRLEPTRELARSGLVRHAARGGASRDRIGLSGSRRKRKPHDPTAYETDIMAADVVRLLDHLEIERADFLGYSMGGRIGTEALYRHPERFNAGVLAGIGAATIEPARRGRSNRRRLAGRRFGGRDGPARQAVSGLRRDDRQRPQGARGLCPDANRARGLGRNRAGRAPGW